MDAVVNTIVTRSGHRTDDVEYSTQLYGLVDEAQLVKLTISLQPADDDIKFHRYRINTLRNLENAREIWATPYYSIVPDENLVVMYGPCDFYEMEERSYTRIVREVRRQLYLHGGRYGIVTRMTLPNEINMFKQLVRVEAAFIESNPSHTYHSFKQECLDKWIFEHQQLIVSVLMSGQTFDEYFGEPSVDENNCFICYDPRASSFVACNECGYEICAGCRLSLNNCPMCRVGTYS